MDGADIVSIKTCCYSYMHDNSLVLLSDREIALRSRQKLLHGFDHGFAVKAFQGRRGDAIAEPLAVALGGNATVGDDDDAPVVAMPYQAAEALPKADDRIRDLIVHEGVSSRRLNLLTTCRHDRVGEYGKWQACQHNTGE